MNAVLTNMASIASFDACWVEGIIAGRPFRVWVDRRGTGCPVLAIMELAGEEDLMDSEYVIYSGIWTIKLATVS